MLGYLRLTANCLGLLRILRVQVAKHVERGDIARIILDYRPVLVDSGANFALRDEALGVAHGFSPIKHQLLGQNLRSVCKAEHGRSVIEQEPNRKKEWSGR